MRSGKKSQPFICETVPAKHADKAIAKDRIAARYFNSYIANFSKSGDPGRRRLAELIEI